jgi:hypothetical protein
MENSANQYPIAVRKFYDLTSENLQNKDEETQKLRVSLKRNLIQNNLGVDSYPEVILQIFEKISQAECSSNVGKKFCKDVLQTLNESALPILSIKPFITGAEQIAGDDVTLLELVKFCKSKIGDNNNINFILNLVKEEHFANLLKSNHPAPEFTIKEIKNYFEKEEESVIVEAIKAGLFDSLESDLLKKVKEIMVRKTPNVADEPETSTNLNENYLVGTKSLNYYNPVGIKYTDINSNKVVFLTENNVFEYVNDTLAQNSSVTIPENQTKLVKAINSCVYSPGDQAFFLDGFWDFQLYVNKSGEVFVINSNGETKQIEKFEDINQLLVESISFYKSNPGANTLFNELQYMKFADDFLLLVKNHGKLIIFDNIKVVRNNLNESYVMFDTNKVYGAHVPSILSSNIGHNMNFKTFNELNETCSEILGDNISALFSEQLKVDSEITKNKYSEIAKLTFEQNTLNEGILKIEKLMKIAEENSPAKVELENNLEILSAKLKENLDNLLKLQ